MLVVDDDDDARPLVATILEDCGCNVTHGAKRRRCDAKMSEERPDVLLSDIGMPDEDGYELIRRVRALPREAAATFPPRR